MYARVFRRCHVLGRILTTTRQSVIWETKTLGCDVGSDIRKHHLCPLGMQETSASPCPTCLVCSNLKRKFPTTGIVMATQRYSVVASGPTRDIPSCQNDLTRRSWPISPKQLVQQRDIGHTHTQDDPKSEPDEAEQSESKQAGYSKLPRVTASGCLRNFTLCVTLLP